MKRQPRFSVDTETTAIDPLRAELVGLSFCWKSGRGVLLPGRISEPHGRTIGSARITILVKDPSTGDLVSFRDQELQEGGRYRFFDLPPGEYAVGFWYSGLNQGSGVAMYPGTPTRASSPSRAAKNTTRSTSWSRPRPPIR